MNWIKEFIIDVIREQKEESAVGEVYTFRSDYYGKSLHLHLWEKVTRVDILDEVGSHIKLSGKGWVNKSNFFYYDSIYNKIRDEIKANLQEKI